MNLSVWKWAVVTAVIVALLPRISFRSDSPVWRELSRWGFEVDNGHVHWPGRAIHGQLWATLIVGVIALGVWWWFG